MACIQCCGGMRKCKTFRVEPQAGFVEVKLFFLDVCPRCEHTVVVLKRVDFEKNVSVVRKTNQKARKLFERVKPMILFEENKNISLSMAMPKFYLNCNEFGAITKCRQNLATLQMGLFNPDEGLDLKKRSF